MKTRIVHVVFKTHLDLGFTDLASVVIDRYLSQFIPKAVELARTLKSSSSGARFVWTTGSWMISQALDKARGSALKELEAAVEAGDLVWHGLPFTTHTELMNRGLFDFGLSLAAGLDARFHRRTIAAKMSDVPGHTLAMVPPLAAAGIQYLHLGVNEASRRPQVPQLFLWRVGDSEIVVHYDDSYGDATVVGDEALVFAHTGDNLGPPDAAAVEAQLAALAQKFPGAEIRASTLDAFARGILARKDSLPVITSELGDTWIHGVGTDPGKVARYRALLRLRDRWVAQGRWVVGSEDDRRFLAPLLLVPEHTWGLDVKTHLADYRHWSRNDFEAARRRDKVGQEGIPFRFSAFAWATKDKQRSYSLMERSWDEQRAYVDQAAATLAAPFADEARQALADTTPPPRQDDGWVPLTGDEYRLGPHWVRFGEDGSLVGFREGEHQWATEAHPLGVFRYETLGKTRFDAWARAYNPNWRKTRWWAEPDFGKPGMDRARPRPVDKLFSPRLVRLLGRGQGNELLAVLEFGAETRALGAPPSVEVLYKVAARGIEVSVVWRDKPATRLPEALWFSFSPTVAEPSSWVADKLGRDFSPLDLVDGGNKNLHAVDTGWRYRGTEGTFELVTLDAPLSGLGDRNLLRFGAPPANPAGGVHFCLFNNAWGTNFPQWLGGDALFRFELVTRAR